MSKITELRREATEAVRTRRFDAAVKLYERICGLDGSNPGYRNELGDVHIKMGDIPSGVANFEKAIELYMAVGLTNNAVAVHKKILRFDPDRLDSHWGLGEIRRRQGLETEASSSFLDFLGQADKSTPGHREVFLDRCSLLIENMADDLQILSTLEKLFERWDMPEERARVLVCKAKLAHESGELEVAGHYLARASELSGDLKRVPEYAALAERMGPAAVTAATRRVVELPARGPSEAEPEPPTAAEEPQQLEPRLERASVQAEPSAGGGLDAHVPHPSEQAPHLELELESVATEDAAKAAIVDVVIDRTPVGGKATPLASKVTPAAEHVAPDPPDSGSSVAPDNVEPPEPIASDPKAAPAAAVGGGKAGYNLLDAILADDVNVDIGRAEQEQMDTIVQDLQGQMGSEVAPDDHKGQYDLGLMFMDMALYPQAVEAFERAAVADPIRLKALEMKGTCLRRMGRLDEALTSYREGLRVTGHPARHYLGLLYEVGTCLEELGRAPEAMDYYGRVVALDAGFLDVQQRLARLQTARR